MHLCQERGRLAAKGLSKVSESRQRYLLGRGAGDKGANRDGPVATIASGLHVFVRIMEGQQAAEIAKIILAIEQG